jgi:hypothetical protein
MTRVVQVIDFLPKGVMSASPGTSRAGSHRVTGSRTRSDNCNHLVACPAVVLVVNHGWIHEHIAVPITRCSNDKGQILIEVAVWIGHVLGAYPLTDST